MTEYQLITIHRNTEEFINEEGNRSSRALSGQRWPSCDFGRPTTTVFRGHYEAPLKGYIYATIFLTTQHELQDQVEKELKST